MRRVLRTTRPNSSPHCEPWSLATRQLAHRHARFVLLGVEPLSEPRSSGGHGRGALAHASRYWHHPLALTPSDPCVPAAQAFIGHNLGTGYLAALMR